MRINTFSFIAATVMVLGSFSSARAVDGVIEINQALADAGDVTPGDTAGMPVTLSQGGSYHLTGDLQLPDASTVGILITADHVNIDLNGFSITGPTVCSGNPPGSALVCSPVGSGHGILVSGSRRGVVIRNGAVNGAGGDAIACEGEGCRVEAVTARNAGNDGIVVGPGGIIRDCHVSRIRFTGLVGANGAIIRGNTTVSNGLNGIATNGAALVTGNIARSNFQTGLVAGLSGGVMAGFGGNVFSGNGSGDTQGGIEIDTNQCGNNTTCP